MTTKKDFAGVRGQTGRTEFTVYGLECSVHQDTDSAQYFNLGQHLLPLRLEPTIKVDRYDVRLLLDEIDAPEIEPGQEAEDFDEQELDHERYLELELPSQPVEVVTPAVFDTDESESMPAEPVVPSEYAAVGFAYAAEPATPITPAFGINARPEALDVYLPPVNYPAHLGEHLPESGRIFKVMVQTAGFVREARQMEFLLRVKQAHNKNFSFLMPGTKLHPFFRWLVDANPAIPLLAKPVSTPGVKAAGSQPEEGLSLLSRYGSKDTAASTSSAQSASSGSPSDPPLSAAPHEHESVQQQQGCMGSGNASSSHPSGPMPSSEMQLIITKLAGFIQKYGIKFEATIKRKERGNPRFAFLMPWNEFHWLYRKNLVDAIVSRSSEEGSAAEPAPSAAAKGGPAVAVLLKANPSLNKAARRVFGPMPQASAAPSAKADEGDRPSSPTPVEDNSAAAQISPTASHDPSLDGHNLPYGHQPARDEAPPGLTGTAAVLRNGKAAATDKTELAGPREPAEDELTPEERKAKRRRLARQFLQTKKQQGQVSLEEARRQQLQALAMHRQALALDRDDVDALEEVPEEPPEPGEIPEPSDDGPLQRLTDAGISSQGFLPALETLLEPSRELQPNQHLFASTQTIPTKHAGAPEAAAFSSTSDGTSQSSSSSSDDSHEDDGSGGMNPRMAIDTYMRPSGSVFACAARQVTPEST
ncbi:hypothetical protein WJX84_009010 [Apatococcus fuscideae]|uniref:SURP motif domain-containing protein n=1 Tax=Apatococcus fuscideae TaxID=2026836 RepID=A0AAW1SQC5_9CHLO